jgi:hypothetical protein
MDRLAPPIRARGQTGDGDLVPFRWAPVGVNPTEYTQSAVESKRSYPTGRNQK